MDERRIVSLCPSLTQTVCDLGLRSSMVGATKFCVDPPDLHRHIALVGGTKDPDFGAIHALKPTAVLVNEEENKPEHIAALEEHFRVLRTFPRAPEDVASMLRSLGVFLEWREPFEGAASSVEKTVAVSRQKTWEVFRFLYFIWRDPYMVAGRDTYISRLLEVVGGQNAQEGAERYPCVSLEECMRRQVDVILLSTEPYPFRRRDAKALREAWPQAPNMMKIDGKLMSWHGTLTIEALEGLADWREKRKTAMISRFDE